MLLSVLAAGLACACSKPAPALDSRSKAPEYSGSSALPPDPKTLAALEAAETPAPATAPSAASSSPAPVSVPRLPGTPDLQPDGSYLFSGGGLELIVDPKRGGRAVRFSIEGKNALAGPEVSPESQASSFWPSPQSEWSWPPPAEIDSSPYSAELEGSVLVLKSEVSTKLELSVVKRYRLDTARRSVEVSYTLVNASERPRSWAPWEIHRVPSAGGLSFYPSAQKLYPQSTLKLNPGPPVTWFAHDQNRETKPVKAFADGAEGWLASARDGVLLIKSFSDTPETAHAPGQGEIELYADYDVSSKLRRYVELAQQGPYAEIPAGGSTTWTVRWFLRKLPHTIALKPGNPELVGFVRGVIQ